MRGLLAELIDLLSKDYELNNIDSANNCVSYIRVPKTSSNGSFQNSKEWLDVAIKVAGTKHGGTYEAVYRISNHLLRFYQDSVLAACETQRIHVSKPLSATQLSSMMNASEVSGKSEQEIKKHLKAHLGPGFCPSQRCVGMLSEGHGVVNYGYINFTYEGKQQYYERSGKFATTSPRYICVVFRLGAQVSRELIILCINLTVRLN